MGWTSPEARELFQWFVKHEAERRSRDRQKVAEALQAVPVTQETLDALGALSPEDAKHALRTHPGYPTDRKIESVRTMLDLFRRALVDLTAAIAEFPDLGGPDRRIIQEKLEEAISSRVNKEFFAALGAAKTLVDYSRRLRDLLERNMFDSKLRDSFDAGEHALIMGLRNVVLHQVHSRANWQKRWLGKARTTHFVIQREDLLAEGDLSSIAREHLDGFGTACDVTELLRSYSEKVDRFYDWLLPQVESHLPLEVSDFRACSKAVRCQHSRLSYEVMIGLWAQAGADPYLHLPKYLTTEQLKGLEAFPQRSPEQVSYVISCMDKDEICDDHLREVIYRLFKVPR